MEQNALRTERKKIWLLRIIAAFSALSFLLLLGTASALLSALGEIRGMAEDFGALSEDFGELSEEMETMSSKVQEAAGVLTESASGLSEVDWPALAASVQEAAESAETGMQEASEALTSLDLESLNQAITDLGQVVGPLVQFVSRFG